MMYILDQTRIDIDDLSNADRLEQAYAQKARLLCSCRAPHPELYLAKAHDKIIAKRMPNTGHTHDPSCPSFDPPEDISGLAQVNGSAIQNQDDHTLLKLDFALSMRGRRPAPPPSTGTLQAEAEAPPKKLKLSALLHYLWYEGDLCKWIPQFTRKRNWWVIRGALRHSAEQKIAKSVALSTRLYIPEAFNPDRKDDIKARRAAFFATLSKTDAGATPLGIVIAEYKAHEPTAMGARFVFKHLPDCKFFADTELLKRFERIFERHLQMAQMFEHCHLVTIATFSMAPAGYPVLHEIALMPVTQNWIPFEDQADYDLIEHLTHHNRRFIKQMRFNLPPDTPIASAVLTDTAPDPTALYITQPHHTDDQRTILENAAQEGTLEGWLWDVQTTFPVLPHQTRT